MDIKLSQIPFARLLIPFALGIITALLFPFHPAFIYSSIFFLLLIFAWRFYEDNPGSTYSLRWVYGALVGSFLFSAGYSVNLLRTPSIRNDALHIVPSANKGADSLIISIISIPQEKDKAVKATAEVEAISIKGKFTKTTGKVLIYFHKDSLAERINYGDVLLVKTELKEIESPSNPAEFDYRQFLYNKGIYYEGYAFLNANSVLSAGRSQNLLSLQQFANENRKKLVTLLNEKIGGDAAHVASAILLGYREDLSRSVVQTFVDSGTVHVICVAGLHVGIIFLILSYIIVFPSRWKNGKLYSTILIILLLWFYALFTGLATPVLRACTMFSFLTMGRHFRRYTNSINTIAASAFLMLLFNPYSIADSGFQLSYLSVLGILVIYKPLVGLFEPRNFLLAKIWELICVSASAQIAIFPLSLLYFHQFPNYFLFTNILVVPLLSVAIISGLLFFLTSRIPLISTLTNFLLQKSLLLMNYIVSGASHLPGSVSKGITISTLEALLLYVFMISLFIFLHSKRYKPLFIALSFLAIFFSIRVIKDIIHSQQQLFVIYNIPGKPAYSFVSGKESVMPFSKVDSNDITYHIQYHWWELGTKENKILRSDTNATMLSGILLLENRFAQFNNCRFAFVGSDIDMPPEGEKVNVQQIVVSGGYKQTITDLKNAFTFDTIIFDSSVPTYKLDKWKKECEELNIHYYDVRTQGALVEQL